MDINKFRCEDDETYSDAGKMGRGFDFTSTYNFYDPGEISIVPNTIACWIYLDSTIADGTRCGTIMGNYEAASPNYCINVEVYTDGRPRWYWNNGNPSWIPTGIDLRRDEWVHVCWVRSASDGKTYLYVDGVEEASTTSYGSEVAWNDATYDPRIGCDYANTRNHFLGYVDEIFIASKPLPASDVKRVMLGMHPFTN